MIGPALADRAIAAQLLSIVAPILVASPAFRDRSRWPHACAVLRRESKRVTSRADLAGWFVANGMPAQARECLKRKVPRGSILCWLEVDDVDVAGAGFVVLDVTAALRAAG
ncbi:MAG: hypothetical protein KIT84_26465 [Labilithrix sp.]|nr:hypothetical protein [Labilithrix sp.]MCW5814597.1 hypothetical protein [Labilithrix sp.]